jgi:hypothetical protein
VLRQVDGRGALRALLERRAVDEQDRAERVRLLGARRRRRARAVGREERGEDLEAQRAGVVLLARGGRVRPELGRGELGQRGLLLAREERRAREGQLREHALVEALDAAVQLHARAAAELVRRPRRRVRKRVLADGQPVRVPPDERVRVREVGVVRRVLRPDENVVRLRRRVSTLDMNKEAGRTRPSAWT